MTHAEELIMMIENELEGHLKKEISQRQRDDLVSGVLDKLASSDYITNMVNEYLGL